jgi:hypothetical protein
MLGSPAYVTSDDKRIGLCHQISGVRRRDGRDGGAGDGEHTFYSIALVSSGPRRTLFSGSGGLRFDRHCAVKKFRQE